MKEFNTPTVANNVANYEKPAIEIIEMEPEDGILLTASAGKGSNMPGKGGGHF